MDGWMDEKERGRKRCSAGGKERGREREREREREGRKCAKRENNRHACGVVV